MGLATLISIEEYLGTSYSPDREYVDGEIVERNLGEKMHATIQTNLVGFFVPRRKMLGVREFVELRVQVSPTRFRIPDVTVVRTPVPDEQIFTSPPFLCIEVLSKDDTMQYMQEKIDDYINFGVPYVWIINPKNRKGYVVTRAGMLEATSGVLETQDPKISVPIADLFVE
jgi:Uma2 family endonuclease